MRDTNKLRSLVERTLPEARPELARVLGQLAHDLSTPISTLTMEVYSTRMLLDRLRRSTPAGWTVEGPKSLFVLEEICSNLELASASLTEYISALTELAANSAEPPHAPPSVDPK